MTAIKKCKGLTSTSKVKMIPQTTKRQWPAQLVPAIMMTINVRVVTSLPSCQKIPEANAMPLLPFYSFGR
jgi:hypothetical protein